jgi:uncharacterized membrane protein HdeD (DUF308 family)
MQEAMQGAWWAVLLRGVVAVVFGLACFFWPGITAATLVILFGAYALVDGVLTLAMLIAGRTAERKWVALLHGLLAILIGAVVLAFPAFGAAALLWGIALFAIGGGVFQIVQGIRLRKEISNEGLLIAVGAIAIVFGLILISHSAAGALALILVIGAFALVQGIMLIVLSFHLRSEHKDEPVDTGGGPMTPAAA